MTTTRAHPVRLTQFAHGGGCACKIPPGELEDVLTGLTATTSAVGAPLLVGLATGVVTKTAAEHSLEELDGLARAAGAEVVLRLVQERPAPDPALYLGRGKVGMLKQACAELDVDLVIVDNELSPAQLRNLEKETGHAVLDRTQLILDIFARRARTREGQLQVETLVVEQLDEVERIVPIGEGRTLVAVAGTATTLQACALGLERYDPDLIHRSMLTLAAAERTLRELAAMTNEERAAIPVMPVGRGDVIVAGASILVHAMRRFGFEHALVSETDILDGLALELLGVR